MTPHLENRGTPTIWLKMVPNRAKTVIFVFWVGHRGYWNELHFFLWDCSPDAELQKYVGFFEKSSNGPSTVALFLGVWDRTRYSILLS